MMLLLKVERERSQLLQGEGTGGEAELLLEHWNVAEHLCVGVGYNGTTTN